MAKLVRKLLLKGFYIAKGYFTSAYLDFGDLTEYNVREHTTKKGKIIFI